MTSKKIGLAAVALTGLLGCGQVSNFTVTVEVSGSGGNDKNKLSQIVSAEVTATGAVSDESIFLLENFPKDKASNYEKLADGQLMLCRFQYGTTKESGQVEFQIDLRNGTNGPDGVIGTGKGSANIKVGGSADVTVIVTPNSKF
jgi:hypothetical protein